MNSIDIDPIRLFGDYMKLTGVPKITLPKGPDPLLNGKKLGVINGSSWVSLWSTWFGKSYLPGVQIINAGNEAVQLNFMKAHHEGQQVPPQKNIEVFCQFARDLKELYDVDAILISCSTMNRAFVQVRKTMEPYYVPVIQIDEAMMEQAARSNGKILVIATHGPTVESTQKLLREVAEPMGRKLDFESVTIENAFDLLGEGRIEEHNQLIRDAILKLQKKTDIETVVLAQLSMSVFSFSFPDPEKEFGVKVLNSGETGFLKAAEILRNKSK